LFICIRTIVIMVGYVMLCRWPARLLSYSYDEDRYYCKLYGAPEGSKSRYVSNLQSAKMVTTKEAYYEILEMKPTEQQ
jgi:hypothetical protein